MRSLAIDWRCSNLAAFNRRSSPATPTRWPDGIDWTVTAGYLALGIRPGGAGLCLHGARYPGVSAVAAAGAGGDQPAIASELPEWVRKDTPRCILALGLTMPCTEADILAAYRRKVKTLHPDRGGDRREFLRLQAHFEQAMAFVAER